MQESSALSTDDRTLVATDPCSVDGSDGANRHTFEEHGAAVNGGGFGHVYKVKCLSCSAVFARKDILLQPTNNARWRQKQLNFMNNELEFLQSSQHPHIIDYIDYRRDDIRKLQIYTELCEFGDLENLNDTVLSEEFVWHVCEAVASALAKCHHGLDAANTNGLGAEYYRLSWPWTPILHRDIKPGNIFLAGSRSRTSGVHEHDFDGEWNDGFLVKLGDFGAVCKLEENIPRSTLIGTTPFLAPELMEEANSNTITKWSIESDVWSVGATLYRLLTREFPVYVSKLSQLNDRIRLFKDELAKKNHQVSDLLVRLICECLDPDYQSRPCSLDLLCVSLKAQHSEAAVERSSSFWRTMATSYDIAGVAIVAKTTQNFVSKYLGLLNTRFSATEVCTLMALQALCYPRLMLTSARRLMKDESGKDLSATVFHALARATARDKFLKALCWEKSRWPQTPSLCHLSLFKDSEGFLSSMVAAWERDKELSRFLMDIEAKAQKLESQRLLEDSVQRGRDASAAHSREELEFVFKLLTENDTKSWNLKSSTIVLALSVAAVKGYKGVFNKLVDDGVNISAGYGDRKETPLHFAAHAGNTEMVALLIEKGAIIQRRDMKKRVPLHCAASNGHEETVLLLLDKGASVDAQDDSGRTALHGAAGKGHTTVVSLLLSRAANPSIRGGTPPVTPQEIAERNGFVVVVQLLANHGPQRRPVHIDISGSQIARNDLADGEPAHMNLAETKLSGKHLTVIRNRRI